MRNTKCNYFKGFSTGEKDGSKKNYRPEYLPIEGSVSRGTTTKPIEGSSTQQIATNTGQKSNMHGSGWIG